MRNASRLLSPNYSLTMAQGGHWVKSNGAAARFQTQKVSLPTHGDTLKAESLSPGQGQGGTAEPPSRNAPKGEICATF